MTNHATHDRDGDTIAERHSPTDATDEQREFAERAASRMRSLQQQVESMPTRAWRRPRPWWIRAFQAALATASGAGLYWGWSQPGWWWLMPTILATTFVVGLLIELVAPISPAQRQFETRLKIEIDKLVAEMNEIQSRHD